MSSEALAFPGMSEAGRARLLALGPIWNQDISGHSQIVMDLYAPLVSAFGQEILVQRDCVYGPDPRHRLDVFQPSAEGIRPAVIFVHGGGYTKGNKSLNGVIYDNILRWFAAQGFVGFNLEYRLAPAATYPAGALDIKAAMAWIRENAATYRVDPERMVIIGHSAGGTHVATYMLDTGLGIKPDPGLCGFVLLSARLRADLHPQNPNARNVAAYFGEDPEQLELKSPMAFAESCRLPVFVGIAHYENRFLDQYGVEFALRVARGSGKMPRLVQYQHHNHTSIVTHFGSAEDRLGRDILDFIQAECFSSAL